MARPQASMHKHLAIARQYLQSGERELASLLGGMEVQGRLREGLLLATTHRIVFYVQRFSGDVMLEYMYPDLLAVALVLASGRPQVLIETKKGRRLLQWVRYGDARLFVSAVERYLDVDQQTVAQESQPSGQEEASPDMNEETAVSEEGRGAEILAQIKLLGDLYHDGVLTEDEFKSKKADLLSRL